MLEKKCNKNYHYCYKAKKQDQPLHDKNKRIILTISKILQLHAQLTITVCS